MNKNYDILKKSGTGKQSDNVNPNIIEAREN